jgi:hypothetical protein
MPQHIMQAEGRTEITRIGKMAQARCFVREVELLPSSSNFPCFGARRLLLAKRIAAASVLPHVYGLEPSCPSEVCL